MAINPIDILLVIVVVLSLLNGYRRGFIHGVLDHTWSMGNYSVPGEANV